MHRFNQLSPCKPKVHHLFVMFISDLMIVANKLD